MTKRKTKPEKALHIPTTAPQIDSAVVHNRASIFNACVTTYSLKPFSSGKS